MSKTPVNFASAVRIGVIAARAGIVPVFMGPPGMGKSTGIGRAIATAFGLPLWTLEVAQGDESEITHMKFIRDGAVVEVLGPQLKAVSEEAGVLFLDEMNRSLPRQGLILPMLDSQRRVGTHRLNPDSIIIGAGNYTTSAGAEPWISAIANRVMEVHVLPDVDEVTAHLATMGAPNSELRVVAEDVCLTIERRPSLMQVMPPAGAEEDGVTWASPRQWENAIKLMAESADLTPEELFACLAGLLGEEVAAGFIAVRKLRAQLPSAADIAKAPTTALVPATPDLEVALLGLLPQSLRLNLMSWAYIARLSPEMRAIARRKWMTQFPGTDAASRKAMAAAVAV